MQNYNNEPRRGLLTGRRLAASVRSPRKVRRSHGSRTSAYTPFGAPVGNAALAKRFMFSSEEWFPARSTLNYDLLLYLYRAYSPALARFLSRDPIAEQGGVNLYNFVGNNPVNYWDNWGRGMFHVVPNITDFSNNEVAPGAEYKTDEHGFAVSWTPSAGDECECGAIHLAQSISYSGTITTLWLGGAPPHVDASLNEIRVHTQSGYTSPPPPMKPRGKEQYSYFDSPHKKDVGVYTITAVAICVPDNNPFDWYVMDAMKFEFDNSQRTLNPLYNATIDKKGGFYGMGDFPDSHWGEAEDKWRTKK